MKWSERAIAHAIGTQILRQRCVLLVDRCKWTGQECDVLGVTVDLRLIDIEIKISRADLKKDSKKDKWWRTTAPWEIVGTHQIYKRLDEPEKREFPEKVWKHYYAMPADIWTPELIECMPSRNSGVILMKMVPRWHDKKEIEVASIFRRATPNKDADRLTPEQVIDIARLANLRMWESYKKESH